MENQATQTTDYILNEIKSLLRLIYKKAGIHEPPYRIGFQDEKGTFYIDFIPKNNNKQCD